MSATDTHIQLQSSDGKVFNVEIEVAKKSMTIKTMLEDLGSSENEDDTPVPLPNVDGEILEKVIEWCTYHKGEEMPVEDDNAERRTDDISEWDKEFMGVLEINQTMLFNIILAANYLDIKGLLDLTCKTVANMLKGKTPDEIRATFNIPKTTSKDSAVVAADADEIKEEAASLSASGSAKAQKI